MGASGSRPTAQAMVLRDLFRREGYQAGGVSEADNRYARLVDVAQYLTRHRRDFDVVILEVYGGASFVVEDMASALARRFGLRLVMHLHGGALPEFYARYPTWARRVLRRANAIVAPSAYLARSVERFGLEAVVIPNVVDLTQYELRRRGRISPRLFWMRSVHPVYNPIMAVRALAELRDADARLTLAGQDKGQLDEVRQLANALGVQGAITYPGFLDMAGKRREAGSADIYINTNRVDNAPVAVLEAAAMGLPIVSTDVGGIPDLLEHEHTALLVPNDDAPAMAAAIRRLVDDPALAHRLVANARELAERSSWENVLPQWETFLSPIPHRRRVVATASAGTL